MPADAKRVLIICWYNEGQMLYTLFSGFDAWKFPTLSRSEVFRFSHRNKRKRHVVHYRRGMIEMQIHKQKMRRR